MSTCAHDITKINSGQRIYDPAHICEELLNNIDREVEY
jgi:hypothetical protein